MRPILAILWLTALIRGSCAGPAAESLREPGFTAMWWTEGLPHFLSMKGAPPPPVLCLRSGEIGLLIDTKSLRLLHAGRFAAKQAKDAALEAGTKPLLALPAAELQMSVVWAGKTFTCTGRGPEPKDEFFQGTYYPEEHLDRLDRWRLTLRNEAERDTVARLIFVQEQHLPITGFTPMLCDPDGTPSGLPVQISKNWHQRPEKGHIAHEGPWFHGCTMLELPAKSRRELVFQMVYGPNELFREALTTRADLGNWFSVRRRARPCRWTPGAVP